MKVISTIIRFVKALFSEIESERDEYEGHDKETNWED